MHCINTFSYIIEELQSDKYVYHAASLIQQIFDLRFNKMVKMYYIYPNYVIFLNKEILDNINCKDRR